MGTCGGDETKPYKFSLQDLQDLKSGSTKDMPRGCGPSIGGTQGGSAYDWLVHRGFGWPDNGEFEWGGLGDGCNMCSDVVGGYGCECTGGGSISGSRGRVKRKAYLADATKCCFANFNKDSVKTMDGKTCDPDHRNSTSSTCTNLYREHCKSGNNLVNDEKCTSLANSNSNLYNELMKPYCNANVDNALSTPCINWCKSNSTECNVLNLKTDCIKYGYCMDDNPKLCSDKCTDASITALQASCKKYGLDSEQGMRLYGCSDKAIKQFLDDCDEFDVSEETCTAVQLQNAKTNEFNKQQLKIAEKSQQQSQENYKETQNTINEVLGLAPPPSAQGGNDSFFPKEMETFFSENGPVVIGAVVGVSMLSLLSSSTLVLLT